MTHYHDIDELLRKKGVNVCLFSVSHETLVWVGSAILGLLLGLVAIWLR